MKQLKQFKPHEAERLTGVDADAVRVARSRGALSKLKSRGRFSAIDLAEILLSDHLAQYVMASDVPLTVRAKAAAWIARWALIESGDGMHSARLTSTSGDAPEFLVTFKGASNWKDSKFTNLPVLERETALVVNLYLIGKALAKKAIKLTEDGIPSSPSPTLMIDDD